MLHILEHIYVFLNPNELCLRLQINHIYHFQLLKRVTLINEELLIS